MKLASCVLLLCASSVLAKDVTIGCTGLFKSSCPWGYRQEWHGRNMLNAYCSCVRPETKQEAEKRLREEGLESCESSIQTCAEKDHQFKKGSDPYSRCDLAIKICDRDGINNVCNSLREKRTVWQCDAGSYDVKQKEQSTALSRSCQQAWNGCTRESYNIQFRMNSCEKVSSVCGRNELDRLCKQNGADFVPACNAVESLIEF